MHEVPSCVKRKIVPMAENLRWQQPLPAFPAQRAGRFAFGFLLAA
jgi:hypothetical protein